MIVKTALLVSLAAATSAVRAADPYAHSPFLHKWADVQLYLKPKYNMVSTWDQEFGIQATVWHEGDVAVSTNFCYDPTYMIRLDQKPHFSLGVQATYFLTNMPWKLGVYTKSKASPFPYTYKQETGFTWRLFTSKHFVVSSNLAYIFTLPFHRNAKPQWVGLVNFQFPLG